MQLYARITWFNFGTFLAYPLEMFASAIKPIVELGFTLLFWSVVAASTSSSISLKGLIAYFLLVTGFTNLTLLSNVRFGGYLAEEIKDGKLTQALIKPINPLAYELSQKIGNSGVTFLVSGVFVVAGLIIQPPASLLGVFLFLAYVPLALAISYGLNVLVGTVAFFTTEAGSIKNVVAHIINVFSGALVPLYLFPGLLKGITLALPFASAAYGPVQALQTTQLTGAVWLQLATAAVWAVVLTLLANRFWRRGLRKYEAIGI